MMNNTCTVGSWGSIAQGCPMEFRVKGDVAELLIGGVSGYLEIAFDAGSLRELVKLGSGALMQMDARSPGNCPRSA